MVKLVLEYLFYLLNYVLLILFIRNRIVICAFLTLYEGGKLIIPFYVYFPLLVSNRPLPALL
jgi:hypothetical protein